MIKRLWAEGKREGLIKPRDIAVNYSDLLSLAIELYIKSVAEF
jgi:predicted nucleic-acid-binding protein